MTQDSSTGDGREESSRSLPSSGGSLRSAAVDVSSEDYQRAFHHALRAGLDAGNGSTSDARNTSGHDARNDMS